MFETAEHPTLFTADDAAARVEARVEQRVDVIEFLKRNPGSTAAEVARALGLPRHEVSTHLYHGAGRVFASLRDRWFAIPR